MKTRSLFGFLALFVVIGLSLTCLLIYLFEAGLFTRWEPVGQIPDTTARLIDGDPYVAYLQTADNRVFSCKPRGQEECWEPAEEVSSYSYDPEPCRDDLTAFWGIMNAPKDMVSCIHVEGGYAEMGFDTVYALESNGALWRWSDESSAYGILVYPVLILVGGVLASMLGSAVWVVRRFVLRGRVPAGERLFTPGEIILLALPWVFVAGLVLLWVVLRLV